MKNLCATDLTSISKIYNVAACWQTCPMQAGQLHACKRHRICGCVLFVEKLNVCGRRHLLKWLPKQYNPNACREVMRLLRALRRFGIAWASLSHRTRSCLLFSLWLAIRTDSLIGYHFFLQYSWMPGVCWIEGIEHLNRYLSQGVWRKSALGRCWMGMAIKG